MKNRIFLRVDAVYFKKGFIYEKNRFIFYSIAIVIM